MRVISLLPLLAIAASLGFAQATAPTPEVAVGPQYDSTHVYVAPEDFHRFVQSILATFGGTTTKEGEFQVTPTPSRTMSQVVLTPAGTLSVFGFKTPIPYPFGVERTGYLVTDLDGGVEAARRDGADVLVAPFNDPIGRDGIVQWPGGVNMQLYWHTTPPSYPALKTIPENRVYVSLDRVEAFTGSFLAFSDGKVISDEAHAPGVEIGRPSETYRRIRIEIRVAHGAGHRRPSPVPLRARTDGICRHRSDKHAGQSQGSRREGSHRPVFRRWAKCCHGAVSGRLYRGNPFPGGSRSGSITHATQEARRRQPGALCGASSGHGSAMASDP
jgi:hypothetical protein